MQCPACGRWFDVRALRALAHLHDAEIEIGLSRSGDAKRCAVLPAPIGHEADACEA